MILSIDWDYFFPHTENYDWSHHESFLFQETIWHIRCTNHNLLTGKPVIEEYRPTVPRDFWNIITNTPELIVTDSHLDIWEILNNDSIVNIDAHHDCGYLDSFNQDTIDCGSWGYFGRTLGKIKKFKQVYPKWRLDHKEKALMNPDSVQYHLPKPRSYDLVFLCRSGYWTPPWSDHLFQKFVRDSGLHKTIFNGKGWHRRHPTLKECKSIIETFKRAETCCV